MIFLLQALGKYRENPLRADDTTALNQQKIPHSLLKYEITL
jgi:hypothetical protein